MREEKLITKSGRELVLLGPVFHRTKAGKVAKVFNFRGGCIHPGCTVQFEFRSGGFSPAYAAERNIRKYCDQHRWSGRIGKGSRVAATAAKAASEGPSATPPRKAAPAASALTLNDLPALMLQVIERFDCVLQKMQSNAKLPQAEQPPLDPPDDPSPSSRKAEVRVIERLDCELEAMQGNAKRQQTEEQLPPDPPEPRQYAEVRVNPVPGMWNAGKMVTCKAWDLFGDSPNLLLPVGTVDPRDESLVLTHQGIFRERDVIARDVARALLENSPPQPPRAVTQTSPAQVQGDDEDAISAPVVLNVFGSGTLAWPADGGPRRTVGSLHPENDQLVLSAGGDWIDLEWARDFNRRHGRPELPGRN